MSERILVTGGAGYIGSHVSKALAEAGFTPVCYDTLETGHARAVRWGPLEKGDIGDAERLHTVFIRYTPRAVIHLAAYTAVGESMREPARYLHNNAAKSAILLTVALRHRIDRFVFSSTCAVYGMPQMPFVGESHPIAPLNPYAVSKARVENMLTTATNHGLRAASLRYFNVAGADPGGMIGETQEVETRLIPLAVDAALGLGPPLVLMGDDYSTPDGSCIRDFVHVSDVAAAHLRALARLDQVQCDGIHEIFNVGSGSGYSVLQILDETARIAGRPVPYTVGPRRPGDAPRLVANIAKAQHQLNWRPHRGLPLQIEHTLRWRGKMLR